MSKPTSESIYVDRDSLHILPLSDLPMQTPGLARARLIKNVRLESVVEMFNYANTGSGQLGIEDLPQEFGWTVSTPPDDLIMLRRLGELPSYDVYSLRVSLRDQGIEVNSVDALKLSPEMQTRLTEYMKDFTRPLIAQIYGGDELDIRDFNDVVKLFRDPDVERALEKIRTMATKLEIRPEEIPRFMEDYGDIFLSLSYYRQCLDSIEPVISGFLDAIDELRRNYQYKTEIGLMQTCNRLESVVNERMSQVTGRFENFERGTRHMWDNISAERFRNVESVISGYHTTIGGVLCALAVKMDGWQRLFPNPEAGAPAKKAEFIMGEMRQGVDRIITIEDDGPMLAELSR
ncbi:MAG: hypothetical protein VW405_12635, partial [Rhodospirillaceae bacterium]